MYQHTNKLILETSPYLLQHAHNPVEWYPWCDEALQKAKSEDRPILVSIGYAACHWCHVMERESFEDEKVAAFMNEHFINIKIDREERPDLDHIYMDAVQTMTGSGGWPLNVFLTPDAKPFYGGTYFPPVRIHNRMSWMDTLEAVVNAYKEKRDQVAEQAGKLVEHLIKSNSFGIGSSREESTNFASADQHNAFEALMNSSDKEWGGFGNAPKFPQTFSIRFLLRYHYYFENSEALNQARLSLDKMIAGGLYDQVGGGFSRYSTDTEWLVPHFEKMLYDNALLVEVLSEAYQLTGKLRYKEVIGETISFVEREMMHRDHGFYSAIDADSEGEEGKFYVWERREVEDLLGQDAEIFCDYFDISLNGNWEGKNILNIRIPTDEYASRKDIDPERLNEIIRGGKKILFRKRETRVRPALDDKIILGWNALMNTSLSKAFAATGDPRYRKLALTNMEFLLNHFSSGKGNRFFHTWKDGVAKIPAFLDDYACLIRALTNLYEITGEGDWLIKARDLMIQSLKLFSDNEKGYLSYTATDQKDVIIRKKEIYDGALPSGNSIMAGNLCQLSVLFDNPAWMKWGQSLVESLGQVLVRYPSSFSNWNCLLLDLSAGYVDLAITGKSPGDLHEQLLAVFIPNRILTISSVENEHIAPLMGKRPGEKTKVFVCKDKTCLPPVEDFDSVLAQIHS